MFCYKEYTIVYEHGSVAVYDTEGVIGRFDTEDEAISFIDERI